MGIAGAHGMREGDPSERWVAVVCQMEMIVQEQHPDGPAHLQVPGSLNGVEPGERMVGILKGAPGYREEAVAEDPADPVEPKQPGCPGLERQRGDHVDTQ